MPFSPKQILNLHLWLRADAITGLANNTPLTTWFDASDNGYHVTQATASRKPLYFQNIVNGKPAVGFGGDDALISSAFSAVAQPRTVFVVCNNNDASGAHTVLDGIASGNRQAVGFQVTTGKVTLGGGASYVGSTGLGTGFCILAAYFDGASSEAFAGGPSQGVANAGSNSLTGYTVGAAYDLSAFHSGFVCEVLVYSRRLSAAERNQVEDYLAAKYAIPVTPYRINAAAVSMRGWGETFAFYANQPTTWRADVPGRLAVADSYNAVYIPPNRTSSQQVLAVNASAQTLTATVTVTGKVPYDPSLESEGKAAKRYFESTGEAGGVQVRRKSSKKRFFKLVWKDRTVDPELEDVIDFWRWHHGRSDRPFTYYDPYTKVEYLCETDSPLSYNPPSHNQTTYRGALKEK